jgi:hypothetical protein
LWSIPGFEAYCPNLRAVAEDRKRKAGQSDSEDRERKTERQLTVQKVQDAAADMFRKHDKLKKKGQWF